VTRGPNGLREKLEGLVAIEAGEAPRW